MKKQLRAFLILALFFISVGGMMMHLRLHSPAKVLYGYVPFVAGMASTILITLFFCFRKTLHLAYILNGFTAIIGTIAMAHFSIKRMPIIPDILFLWGKFFVGYVIFNLTLRDVEAPAVKLKGPMLARYPNMGFWFVHLFMLSLVYYLGNLLWR